MRIPTPGPFTPPDWRFRRVEYLLATGATPSRGHDDDRWAWEAWRFFRALARCDGEPQRQRVRRRHPDVTAAVEFHDRADDLTRAELQARLLARETIDSVASRFGLTAEAVRFYVAVFFDVLGALDATDYIVLEVIGLSPTRTLSEKDIELWLKLYAYIGGPHVLDEVVDYYRNPEPISGDVAQLEPPRRERVARRLRVRAAILARCVGDGDPRALALAALAEQLETERRGRRADGLSFSPVGHGDDVLERIPQDARVGRGRTRLAV